MHTLVGLVGIGSVVATGYGALWLMRRVRGWRERRDLQLLVLGAPLVTLLLALMGTYHVGDHLCYLDAPPPDYLLGLALPAFAGLFASGGAALGVLRLVLLELMIRRAGQPAPAALQTTVARVADRFGVRTPRLRIVNHARPIALVGGLKTPTVLLSSWIIDALDAHEAEAVVAHEIAHLVRRDHLILWLATLLRDAFAYLPPTRAAYCLLQREHEMACDDLVVTVTGRPLALASALAKVWQHTLAPLPLRPIVLLTGGLIEDRIERLLQPRAALPAPRHARLRSLVVVASSLAALAFSHVVIFIAVMLPMGCLPAALFGHA